MLRLEHCPRETVLDELDVAQNLAAEHNANGLVVASVALVAHIALDHPVEGLDVLDGSSGVVNMNLMELAHALTFRLVGLRLFRVPVIKYITKRL